MKITELKVKRKSLADEARTIRAEERKLKRKRESTASLHYHRTQVVRPASRYAHLAHAYLTGRKYVEVERSTREGNAPDPVRLAREIITFGGPEFTKDDFDWKDVQFWLDGYRESKAA